MAIIKRLLQGLSKKEFDEAYEELLAEYADKLDKHPLPTKREIAEIAMSMGEITIDKYMEFTTD